MPVRAAALAHKLGLVDGDYVKEEQEKLQKIKEVQQQRDAAAAPSASATAVTPAASDSAAAARRRSIADSVFASIGAPVTSQMQQTKNTIDYAALLEQRLTAAREELAASQEERSRYIESLAAAADPSVNAGDATGYALDQQVSASRAQVDQLEDQLTTSQGLAKIYNMPAEDRALLRTLAKGSSSIFSALTTGEFQNVRSAKKALLDKGYTLDELNELAEAYSRYLNENDAQQRQQEAAQEATEHPLGSNIKALGASAVGGVAGSVDALVNVLKRNLSGSQYNTIDPNLSGYALSDYAAGVRGQTAQSIQDSVENETLGKTVSAVYSGVTSAADNLVRIGVGALTGGGSYATLGLAAAASFQDGVQSASQRGGTPAQALTYGVANAGLEVITEKIPLDELLGTGTPRNWAQLAKNAAKQAGIEIITEEANFLGGLMADAAIMGQKSEFNTTINDLIASGCTYQEARGKAYENLFWQAYETAVSSGLSGGLLSGGASAVNVIQNGGFPAQQTQTQPQTVETVQPKADVTPAADAGQTAPSAAAIKTIARPASAAQAVDTAAGSELSNADIMEAVLRGEDSAPAADSGQAINDALKSLENNGSISNNLASRILKSAEAVELLRKQAGMELPGTASGNRNAVKEAVSRLYAQMQAARQAEAEAVTAEETAAQEAPQAAEVSAVSPDSLDAVGAASRDFSGLETYNDLLTDDNVQPARATDAKQEEVPIRDANGRRVSEFAHNAMNSAAISGRDVDNLKRLIQEGAFGHDVQHMTDVHAAAVERIQDKGTTRSVHAITKAIANGKTDEHTIAEAQVLLAIYSNRKSNHAQEMASELLLDLSEMSRQAGRQLNMFKLLRRLTPEGRLMTMRNAVNRLTDELNAGRSAGNQVSPVIPPELEAEYMNACEETTSDELAAAGTLALEIESSAREHAGRAADNALLGFFGESKREQETEARQGQLVMNDVAVRTGERVADTLTREARERNTSIEDILFQEIMSFVNDKVAAETQSRKGVGDEARNLDALGDYYRYRSFFQTAWNVARDRVETAMGSMKADDPRIDVIEAFLATESIENHDPIARTYDYGNPKSTIRKGAKEAANALGIRMDNRMPKAQQNTVRRQMRDILLENTTQKESAARMIADCAASIAGLDGAEAEAMAADIVEAFYSDLAQQSARRVAQMFGQHPQRKRIQATITQRLERLYNMGAFSNQDYRQAAFDSLFGENSGIDIPDQLMEQLVNAAEGRQNEVIGQIQQAIADQLPSTLPEKWNALRYVNMLGNFKTQARNLAGNAGMAVVTDLKNVIGASLEAVAVKAGANVQRTKSAFVNPALLKKAKADFVNVEKQAMGAGKYADWEGASFTQGVQNKRRIFTSRNKTINNLLKPLEAYRTATEWAMENKYFGDAFFSKSAYAKALSGYLQANGVTADTFESADPALLEKARAYAVKEAQEATFRDDNTLSTWISKLGRKKTTPKAVRILSEGVMPFRKTPANVLVRAEEYSPLGLLNTAVTAARAAKPGSKVTDADVINSLSKSLTGTGLLVLGMSLRNLGFLSGAEDEDENQAEFDDQTGLQPYSILFPDGTSYTLDWLAPAALPLFMGAQLMDLIDDGGLELKDLESAFLSLADPMLEMSMLQGINDTLDNIKYTDNNLGQLAINAMLSYLTQGLTNTLLGQIERGLEGERTTTYVDKDGKMDTWLQQSIGAASRKIPFWDFQQTTYVDAFGQTQDNGGLLYNLLSPGYLDKRSMTQVQTELQRLADATGNTSILGSEAAKSYTVGGEETNLTAEEWTRIAQSQGQMGQSILSQVIQSEEYAALSDEYKVKAVEAAYEYAADKSRLDVLGESAPGFSAAWMKGISGKEAETIVGRAVIASSGLTDTQYAKAQKAGFSLDEMKSVSGAVAEALEGMESSNDYDTYRAVLKAAGDGNAADWLRVYGMSDSRLEAMQTAAKSRISALEYINMVEAESGVDKAFSGITEAWRSGESADLETLSEAYTQFKALPAVSQGYAITNASGRIKAYLKARNAGISDTAFADLYKVYYSLDGSASDNATKWAATLDKAVDAGKITRNQRTILWDNLAFYAQVRQDADTYHKISGAGVSAGLAEELTNVIANLTPETEDGSVRTIQKFESIVDFPGLSDSVEEALLKAYMTDSQAEKYDAITGRGYSGEEWAAAYRAYLDGDSKEDDVRGIMEALGVSYSEALAIYRIYNGG